MLITQRPVKKIRIEDLNKYLLEGMNNHHHCAPFSLRHRTIARLLSLLVATTLLRLAHSRRFLAGFAPSSSSSSSLPLPAQMPICVLSPAKSLDETSDFSAWTLTQPPFIGSGKGGKGGKGGGSETAELLETCQALSKAELKSLMSLSDPLAALNHGRFKDFAVSIWVDSCGSFRPIRV